MELSFVSRPSLAGAAASAGGQARSALRHSRPTIFDVPVPVDLHQYGERVRASALGDPANAPVVVLGGISANCFPALKPDGSAGWWAGLAGDGRTINPREHYIIGLDFAADETGAAAPTTAEQARVLAAALDAIAVDRPVVIVGASYGAMVGLALAEAEPHRIDRLVVISAGAEPHPQSSAARELQRRVVALGLASGQGDEALAIARGMAMLTYRTPTEFAQRFDGGIDEAAPLCRSDPGSYLHARGTAFGSVMSPERFLSLSASIDRHRVRPEAINVPCLVIGASSDQLVFRGELEALAARLSGPSEINLLDSLYGHDMFLKEAERVGAIVAPFLARRG